MQAFGLDVTGSTPPGLAPGRGSAGALHAEHVGEDELRTRWPPDGRRLVDRPGLTVDHHPRAGWLVDAPGYGLHALAADGTRLASHLPAVEPWRWQRLLFGQVLPLAAAVQGLTCLHAAAVEVEGRVLAVVGSAGAGKSTLSSGLRLLGGRFVSDDVLAVSMDAERSLVHPGPAYATMDPAILGTLPDEGREVLGPVTGRGEIKHVLAPSAASVPHPLGWIVVLERGQHATVELRPLAEPLTLVLAASFVPYLDDAAAAPRTLDAAARLAAEIPVLRLRAPERVDPAALAGQLLAALH